MRKPEKTKAMTTTPHTPNYTYQATVIRWVDGDTVWLKIDLGFRMSATTDFRLYGIDTPERGQPGWAEATAQAKVLAPVGSDILVTTYKAPDKYGRWLAEIFANGVNVNQSLVTDGLAVPYFGGTR